LSPYKSSWVLNELHSFLFILNKINCVLILYTLLYRIDFSSLIIVFTIFAFELKIIYINILICFGIISSVMLDIMWISYSLIFIQISDCCSNDSFYKKLHILICCILVILKLFMLFCAGRLYVLRKYNQINQPSSKANDFFKGSSKFKEKEKEKFARSQFIDKDSSGVFVRPKLKPNKSDFNHIIKLRFSDLRDKKI